VDEMDDLERMLRRYRPAGPAVEWRMRVVVSVPAGPTWLRGMRDWVPAAAALVLAALFYWLAATERRVLDVRFPPVAPADRLAINMEELL
jgi:hypothetical protein